ncbi:2OG-Fe(II) oxygenase [Roseofilum reptotaenium CS-1145]|nr:2OG-Fe(II) oxygenase [Roseofilum reptotaenium]MDB9518576.1 2OG-Fe(II) oxygenase [Roseofilum reptotaenium CS-1145]
MFDQLTLFESDLMHEVKPVTAGERLTIVSWFLGEE